MTQDLGVGVCAFEASLYEHGVPNEVNYPGNVMINWRSVEDEIYNGLINTNTDETAGNSLWGVCIYFDNDVFNLNVEDGPFWFVGLSDGETIPLYDVSQLKVIFNTPIQTSFWTSFVNNILDINRMEECAVFPDNLNERDSIGERFWVDYLEVKLKACALFALKRARIENHFNALGWTNNQNDVPFDTYLGPYPGLRFYVGEAGETAEEMVNRSVEFSRLSMDSNDKRLVL